MNLGFRKLYCCIGVIFSALFYYQFIFSSYIFFTSIVIFVKGSDINDQILLETFHRHLSEHKLSINAAIEICNSLPSYQLSKPIQGKIPLLHYLLNLYFINKDIRIRQDLIRLAILIISRNIDVNENYNSDPSMLMKAIILRESGLAVALAEAGANPANYVTLSHLFSIPCEPVPLAKLLLHAEKINSKLAAREDIRLNISTILSTASNNDLNSKPVVQHSHMVEYSPLYSILLSNLTSSDGNYLIRLSALQTILNEVVNKIQQYFLLNETSYSMYILTLTEKNQQNRNLLHILALSNGVIPLAAIVQSLKFIVITKNKWKKFAKHIISALSQRDDRGHTPISYAISRYHSHSNIAEALKSLADTFNMTEASYQLATVRTPSQPHPPRTSTPTTSTSSEQPQSQSPQQQSTASYCDVENSCSVNSDGGWSSKRISLENIIPQYTQSLQANNQRNQGDTNKDIDSSSSLSESPQQKATIAEVWGELPPASIFLQDYLYAAEPVIFRGALRNTTMMSAFQKSGFLARHGRRVVPVSSIPYASSFGVVSQKMTLTELADMDTDTNRSATATDGISNSSSSLSPSPYVFMAVPSDWLPSLQRDAPLPKGWNTLGRDRVMQFYLGGSASGAPPHFHGHAINMLAYGEKRWFLYPPSAAFYTAMPALDFLRQESWSPGGLVSAAIQFTQHPGDVVFVPTLWGHSTLNLKQSIGLAYEISVDDFCME